jgi:hypothetical protein
MNHNLIQYRDLADNTQIGLVIDADRIETLSWSGGLYELARTAIAKQRKLHDVIAELRTGEYLEYATLESDGRLLSPVLHPDPAHLLVSGTGLTHLGSADTRAAMHAKIAANEAHLTDSMRMFQMGLEGGKPQDGGAGVQPEWFYKGDGSILVHPGHDVLSPDFALDFGDEAEIVGLYLIGDDCKPYRLGFALGNEFSDHKTEKINYLYLAHSKLRPCSVGPELFVGSLPGNVRGLSRIVREGKTAWEKPFLSGEDNMSHSIANLEYHHFKYRAFLRPGDIHIHFFGTATLSFSDNFATQEGDVFEVQSELFGKPLRNTLRIADPAFATHQKVSVL